jgi:hypothetical protein
MSGRVKEDTTDGCHVPVRPWHAMRHTFASHYVMAGGNLLALPKILGHSKFEMTQIYSHLAPDYVAGESARLSFGPSSPPANLRRIRAASAPSVLLIRYGEHFTSRRGGRRTPNPLIKQPVVGAG